MLNTCGIKILQSLHSLRMTRWRFHQRLLKGKADLFEVNDKQKLWREKRTGRQ